MVKAQVTTPTYLRLGVIDFYDRILEFGLAVEDPRITIEVQESESGEAKIECMRDINDDLCNLALKSLQYQSPIHRENRDSKRYNVIIKSLPQTFGTDEANLLKLAVETALNLLSRKIQPIREIAAKIGLYPNNIFSVAMFEYGGFLETMTLKNLGVGAPIFRTQLPTNLRVVIIGSKNNISKNNEVGLSHSTQRYKVLEALYEFKLFSMMRDYNGLLKALSKLSEIMEYKDNYSIDAFSKIIENVKKLGIARYIALDATGLRLIIILPPTAPSKTLCVIRNLIEQELFHITTTVPRNNGSLIRIVEG